MRKELKRDAVKGVGWAFFSSAAVRVLQVIATLALAKLLAPADFGIFALASIVVAAATLFRDLGFAQVLIYRQGDIRRCANTAFILSLAASCVLALALMVGAPAIGSLFRSPDIVGPTRAMSLALVVTGIASVPLALLDRDLKFRKRTVPELAGACAYAIISVALAAIGLGAWSMVLGWIGMAVVSTVSTWRVSSWRPTLEFDPGDAKAIIAYGKHLMVASVLMFAFFHVDKASIGRWIGVSSLGFYSLAFTLCNLPATNLSHVVSRVMFPTYSKLRNDPAGMRTVYLRTIKYISLAAFPTAVGIVVLAGPLIKAIYGEKWAPAIPLFQVLAFYGLVRSIGSTAGAVFMSAGEPRVVRKVGTLQLLVATPLVYPAIQALGTIGVALLFTFAYLAGALYALANVQRILGINTFAYVNAAIVPLLAAGLAGGASWLALACTGTFTVFAVTGSAAALGCGYALLVFLLDRPTYSEVLNLVVQSRAVGTTE